MTPRGRLIVLFALAAVPLALSPFVPEGLDVGLAANLLLAAIAVIDLLLSPSPAALEITREVGDVMSVGARHRVTFRVRNTSRARLAVELVDSPPEPGQTRGLPARLVVPAGATREVGYHLTPTRRGRNRFGTLYLRFPTRLGLCFRDERRALPLDVRIYPDVQAVRRYELLARRNRLEEAGIKRWRRRGLGGEFERLRDYRREDEPRAIDWKATAKYGRLISREYNVERNQNVLVLLDCGRSMCNEADGIAHLDRGLNAAVILAYIALSQGDNVSFVAFSHEIERAIGPARGKTAVHQILREVFDLVPRYEASDYGRAIEEVLRRQRKRALVILLTHALDEQHLVAIGEYARTLTRNHLMLCILLRDVGLVDLASRVPETDADAFGTAAAGEILGAQSRLVEQLREQGVLVVETLPADLSAAVVNQYLDIKARHLL